MKIVPGEGDVENHLSIIITKGSSIFNFLNTQNTRRFPDHFTLYSIDIDQFELASLLQLTVLELDCAGNIRTR